MSVCTKKIPPKKETWPTSFSLFPDCWRLNLTPFWPPFQAVSSAVTHAGRICRLAQETSPGLVSCLKHVLGARQSISIMVFSLFPSLGVPFPKNFLQICKKILCRLFRVFVHVYIHHFDRVIVMGAEAHVNTCYKHFYYFVTEMNLIDRKELEPLVSAPCSGHTQVTPGGWPFVTEHCHAPALMAGC